MSALFFYQVATGLRFLTRSYLAPLDSGKKEQQRVNYTTQVILSS